MPPLINILTRTTKGREDELLRCAQSIDSQTYKNIRWIVCTDSDSKFRGINPDIYFDVKPTGVPFHWNFYCNNLKERVTDGWFFYLDDDDYLAGPEVLANIAERLTDPRFAVICQFNRGVNPKPVYRDLGCFYRSDSDGEIFFNGRPIVTRSVGTFFIRPEYIIRGKIGGSCIFLHHSQKNIANWDGKRAADYRFIKDVAAKIPLVFVPTVVVQAGNNGRRGK